MIANESQVGGDHYAVNGNEVQHWDYAVHALGNRYLEGNITKYVMRHRHKGTALADLQKARHYTIKLIEEFQRKKIEPLRQPKDFTFSVHSFSVKKGLNHNEDRILKKMSYWKHEEDLLKVIAWIDELIGDAEVTERQRQARIAGATTSASARQSNEP